MESRSSSSDLGGPTAGQFSQIRGGVLPSSPLRDECNRVPHGADFLRV